MDVFLEWLKHYYPLLNWLTVILIAFYVYYTIKTFREIKRQTDLQYEAFLVVASLIKEDEFSEKEVINEPIQKLYNKWRDIITKHIPDAIQAESYLVLELANKGKSDIIYWEINVNVSVSPGRYLETKYNISGENKNWSIKYSGHKENISPDNRINVPIAILGAFPSAEFTWELKYTDTRDVSYQRFAGDNSYKDINLLASPKITQ